MLGQVSWRQPGRSVLLNQMLQQWRHPGGRRRHCGCRLLYWRAFGGTLPLSVFLFVQGKEPAENSSGFGIGQVDMAQIPEGCTQAQALEMIVTRGDLKTDPLQTNGAVGAALGAIDLSGKGYLEFSAVWTRPAQVTVVEVTLHRRLAQFGVDGPVVFHLDPGLRGFVQLIQSQIHDSFEHRQEASFDSVP